MENKIKIEKIDPNYIMIDDAKIDAQIVEVLENIQSHLGYFYRRTLEEVCNLLVTESDMLSIKSKDILRIQRCLITLCEDLETIGRPTRHTVSIADPFADPGEECQLEIPISDIYFEYPDQQSRELEADETAETATKEETAATVQQHSPY